MSDLVAKSRRHFWPPYTSSEAHESREPLHVVSAEGSWLTDASGARYLDACASWWCNNLGHRHPRLVRALTEQAATLAHCAIAGTVHAPAIELAERLCAAAPEGLSRAFFSDDGSTSVEVALKIAFQFFQQNGQPERKRFLTLPGGYHGDTFGAMSLGTADDYFEVFAPLLFGDRGRTETLEEAVERIVSALENNGASIAAVVVEPLIQGAGGMRMYAPSVLKCLREACDDAGALLIADEVFTGFGRTGRMWACDHAGVVPDLLCTAKGLSGGMLPFAATLATERLYDGFRGDASRALMHGHTFCGNPLGAAIALEVLRVYEDDGIVDEAARKSERLARGIEALGRISGTRAPRALGMVAAIELGDGGYRGEMGWRVHEFARAAGVWLRPLGDTVYVCPPLTTVDADLDLLFEVLDDALRSALR